MLHVVGCLYYCISDALSYKHQILHPSPAPQLQYFGVFLMYSPKCPSFSTIQSYTPNVHFTHSFLYLSPVYCEQSVLLAECSHFHNNPRFSFACTFCLFFITLYSTFSRCFWSFIICTGFYWGSLPKDSHYFSIFPHSFQFHSILQFQ